MVSRGVGSIRISLSHCDEFAVAVAVAVAQRERAAPNGVA